MSKTKITDVTAKKIDDDKLEIFIKTSGRTHNITKVVTIPQTNRIAFTIRNPDLKKNMSYHGIVENNKLYLYPIAGSGVLTTEPVIIK